nr:hypothetical protein [Tanacetum cinerariifolium]
LEVIALIAEAVAPKPAALTGSPSSTNFDQDAPSPSNSQTTLETQTPVISNDVDEDNNNLDVTHMNNDLFIGIEESPKTPTFHADPLHERLHEDSTPQGSSSNIRQTHTPFESLEIPYGESKIHIEVLSVLWGNRLPIQTVRDRCLGCQRSDKNKEGLGYSTVPPPHAQIYSPPKKDLYWTGLPEFVDDTVTDYHRPTPSIDASKCNKSKLQSSNFSVFEHGESTGSIMSKLMIKFVKEADCPRVIKINNTENPRKSTVKYDEMYKNISKGPKTREKLLRPQLVRFGDLNKILLNKNNIDDKGYWDSSFSRHMIGNISYLSEYDPYDREYVSFGHGGGKITGKGIIKTGLLDNFKICGSC